MSVLVCVSAVYNKVSQNLSVSVCISAVYKYMSQNWSVLFSSVLCIRCHKIGQFCSH